MDTPQGRLINPTMMDIDTAEFPSKRCVLHPGERASYMIQGRIPACSDCYYDYHEEYRQQNGNLRERPFLQRLIKASLESD